MKLIDKLIKLQVQLNGLTDFIVTLIVKRFKEMTFINLLNIYSIRFLKVTVFTIISSLLLHDYNLVEAQGKLINSSLNVIPFVRAYRSMNNISTSALFDTASSVSSAINTVSYLAVGAVVLYSIYKVGSYVSGTSIYTWLFPKTITNEELYAKNLEMYNNLNSRLEHSYNGLNIDRACNVKLIVDNTKLLNASYLANSVKVDSMIESQWLQLNIISQTIQFNQNLYGRIIALGGINQENFRAFRVANVTQSRYISKLVINSELLLAKLNQYR